MIIHKQQLRRLVDPWWELCLTLKRDPQADQAFGWVLEMWGWALAAARAGVRHQVLKTFQAEPGGVGISNLDLYFIYHYTFDLSATAGGTSWGGSARWDWSKRKFMGMYPPALDEPPSRMQKSAHTFVRLMNEAIRALVPWRPMR